MTCSEAKAEQIAAVMKERVTFPADFWQEAQYFFRAPESYDEQIISKKWSAATAAGLAAFAEELPTIQNNTPEGIKALLAQVLEREGMKMGQVLQALRMVVTGANAGPDLMETMAILGPPETAQRIHAAVERLAPKAV